MTTTDLTPSPSFLPREAFPILDYVEQYWGLYGTVPTFDQFKSHVPNTSLRTWQSVWNNQVFLDALEDRGITLPTTAGGIPSPLLSGEQIACINTLLNIVDGRSDAKKLSDLGISKNKFQGWMKNPQFKAYFKGRSEELWKDAKPDVQRAHLAQARAGNMKAVQLFYEMEGIYSPNSLNGAVDVAKLIAVFIDVCGRHVKDTSALQAISDELYSLVSPKPAALVASGHQPQVIDSYATESKVMRVGI